MSHLTLPIGPSAAGDAGRGLLRVPLADMARLGLRPGDAVALKSTRCTHARVLPQRPDAGHGGKGLGACTTLTANAGAQWGSVAEVRAVVLPELTSIDLRLQSGKADADPLREALCDMVVTVGDKLDLGALAAQLEVMAAEPALAGHVGEATRIRIIRSASSGPAYKGIGGLAAQIALVHEMVETPLVRPELFAHLGVPAPRGILFVGPPGTGKTLLARAVAERTKAAFFQISAPEVLSKHYGDSEAALRKLFEAAQKAEPAILFIDEIDAIAPRRDGLSGEKQVERRVVAQLLSLMDGIRDRGRVVVMAATNLPDAIDPALRRPGRFDREVRFDTPDQAARADILQVHLAQAPLDETVDLQALAAAAHGYVGADLAALAAEAAMAALARVTEGAGSVEDVALSDLWITQQDLLCGLKRTQPSALREAAVNLPMVRFGDIGGLDSAKETMSRALLWPMANPALLERLRLSLPKGLLLAGPPGSGKTLLAQALAGESGLNFLSVPPARLMSQFLGEAERAIADLFRRARQSAPCLLFFDEIDAIAPQRGRGDAALDRIVGQFLLELDGLDGNAGVVVVAATNRIDAIDPALIRPGRFDLVIPIGLPDAGERVEILGVHLRGRPVALDLHLPDIAQQTDRWSAAALATLVQSAARQAMARALAKGDAGVSIEPADFAAALAEQSASAATRSGQKSLGGST